MPDSLATIGFPVVTNAALTRPSRPEKNVKLHQAGIATTAPHSNNFAAACLCCLLFSPLSTAVAQYQVDSWTTDNGLPQNIVMDVCQTPDGYLWLATMDGLVRFDGVRFTVFNRSNTPGILGNRYIGFWQILVR